MSEEKHAFPCLNCRPGFPCEECAKRFREALDYEPPLRATITAVEHQRTLYGCPPPPRKED